MHIPYTLQRSKIYYFNRRHYEAVVRISLQTKCPHEAMVRAAYINKIVSCMFINRDTLRDIHKAATIWLKQRIEEETFNEATRASKIYDSRYIDDPKAPQKSSMTYHDISEIEKSARLPAPQIHVDDLKIRENLSEAKNIVSEREHYDCYKNIAEGVAQQHRLDLDNSGMQTLAYYIAQANVALWEKMESKHSVAFDTASPIDETENTLLSEAWERFIRSKEQGGVTKKTTGKFQSAYTAFMDTVGDITLSKMRYYHAEEYALKISNYPTFRTVGQRNLLHIDTVKELTDGRVKTAVIKDWCNKMGNFAKWCIRNDLLTRNYFEGLAPEHVAERRSWKPSELHLLFNHERFTHPELTPLSQYWLPLLAFASGARINELATLYKHDILEERNIKYFNLTEYEDEKSLKNNNSKRVVPIHSRLIELGFLDFLSNSEEGLLFKDLETLYKPHTQEAFSNPAVSEFSEFKRETLKLSNEVVFHSLRNTFMQQCADNRIQDSDIAAVVGHSQKGMTRGRYATDFSLEILHKAVESVPVRDYTLNVMPHPSVLTSE